MVGRRVRHQCGRFSFRTVNVNNCNPVDGEWSIRLWSVRQLLVDSCLVRDSLIPIDGANWWGCYPHQCQTSRSMVGWWPTNRSSDLTMQKAPYQSIDWKLWMANQSIVWLNNAKGALPVDRPEALDLWSHTLRTFLLYERSVVWYLVCWMKWFPPIYRFLEDRSIDSFTTSDGKMLFSPYQRWLTY